MPYVNLELTCERCGVVFNGHRKSQRFCSHACRAASTSDAARRCCAVDGCDAVALTRGWCSKHYSAFKRTGDPLGWKFNPERRFWQNVSKSAGCWEWQGAVMGGGYGAIKVEGRRVPAHRFAYELLVGPIGEGLEIDHLCRNRSCVNPEHLEPVTRSVNVKRGIPYRARSKAR